jgi:transglutaminase-like putative cysteine protease
MENRMEPMRDYSTCREKTYETITPDAAGAHSPCVGDVEWHAIYLAGQKVGHQHTVTTAIDLDGKPAYRTDVHQEFSLLRAGMNISIVTDQLVREDVDGRPISYAQTIMQGPVVNYSEGRVEGDKLVIKVGVRGTKVRTVPVPDGLCFRALRNSIREEDLTEGADFTLKAFVPEVPERTVIVRVRVGPKEPIQVFEITKWLHRLETELDILPGVPTQEWVDSEGMTWLTRVTFAPNLVLETRKTSREFALAPDDPAEVFALSVIVPDKPIDRPRSLSRLKVRIRYANGQPEPELPSGPYQIATQAGDGLLVEIRRAGNAKSEGYEVPYTGDEFASLIEPTPWLESEDIAITQMARQAVGEEKHAPAAARAIERYVDAIIVSKNLSLGFATAAEAAAQKTGDCTEHAVLAAALARAIGMPSRVVGGLAYAEDLPGFEKGGFGYHMWAEIYVGEWMPVDPALGGHDATHIVLARSGLTEAGEPLEIASAIAQVLGRISISVLEAEY